MKFSKNSIFLTLLVCISYVEARWKPTQGMTWNYVLENKVTLPEKAQVIDIDLEDSSASLIKKYHNAGKKVICYFSGGTIEKYREDFKQYNAVRGLVRNSYTEWPDEKWLDIRIEGIKPLIIKRMKAAVNKKCDAIEVDNLDGWQQKEIMRKWSKPLTKADTIKFAKWLATTAHNLNISIGLKNGLFMINEVGDNFDFAINESCATLKNPECHRYSKFLKQGKAVFGISYKSEMKNKNNSSLCQHLDGLNISMIVKKNRDLIQDGIIFDANRNCISTNKKNPITIRKTTTAKKITNSAAIKKNATNKKNIISPIKKTTTAKKATVTAAVKKNTTSKKNIISPIKKAATAKKATVTSAVKKNTTNKKNIISPIKKTTTNKKATVTAAVKKNTTNKKATISPIKKATTPIVKSPKNTKIAVIPTIRKDSNHTTKKSNTSKKGGTLSANKKPNNTKTILAPNIKKNITTKQVNTSKKHITTLTSKKVIPSSNKQASPATKKNVNTNKKNNKKNNFN